jgi:hypothetical protein
MSDNVIHFDWRVRDWIAVKAVSIRGAALLLNHYDPLKYPGNPSLPPDAQATFGMLKKAVLSRQLEPLAAFAWGLEPGDSFDGVADIPIGAICPDTDLTGETVVSVAALAEWCESTGIVHPFRAQPNDTTTARHLDAYPDKLRAAIEAFEAVSRDPAATAKQSAKAALTAWLAQHKPELSNNARDCIATIANWQPQGGAPKTLG